MGYLDESSQPWIRLGNLRTLTDHKSMVLKLKHEWRTVRVSCQVAKFWWLIMVARPCAGARPQEHKSVKRIRADQPSILGWSGPFNGLVGMKERRRKGRKIRRSGIVGYENCCLLPTSTVVSIVYEMIIISIIIVILPLVTAISFFFFVILSP